MSEVESTSTEVDTTSDPVLGDDVQSDVAARAIYKPGEVIYPENDPLNQAVGPYIVLDEKGEWEEGDAAAETEAEEEDV